VLARNRHAIARAKYQESRWYATLLAVLAKMTMQLSGDFLVDDCRRRIPEDSYRKSARLSSTAGDVDNHLRVVAFAAEGDGHDLQLWRLLACRLVGNTRYICNGEWLHSGWKISQYVCPRRSSGRAGAGEAQVRHDRCLYPLFDEHLLFDESVAEADDGLDLVGGRAEFSA
jgi:hypothetical protein